MASLTRLTIQEPGTYRVSGVVQLQESLVEISGITNAQRIPWVDAQGADLPMAGFTTFEHFSSPGVTPEIQVRGGRLTALSVVPVELS